MKKVYLMIECDVEEDAAYADYTPAARASLSLKNAVLAWYGRMVFQEPVELPDNIQDILRQHETRNVPLHEKLRQAVIEDEKKPAIERWNALIARGAIDKDGNVLLRGPECEDCE